MQYEVIIPCAPKDYPKLETCINRANEFLYPKPLKFHVVAPNNIKINNAVHYPDDLILHPYTDEDIKYRRSKWIFQQLIKLYQDITSTDYYLCLDSDVFFNKPLDVFIENKPVLFFSNVAQHHQPYFTMMKNLLDLDKQVENTFICDFMMMNKKINQEMLPALPEFISYLNNNLNENCLLSEYEMYGNYIYKNHMDMYLYYPLKVLQYGSYYENYQYVLSDLDRILNSQLNLKAEVTTIHSWT